MDTITRTLQVTMQMALCLCSVIFCMKILSIDTLSNLGFRFCWMLLGVFSPLGIVFWWSVRKMNCMKNLLKKMMFRYVIFLVLIPIAGFVNTYTHWFPALLGLKVFALAVFPYIALHVACIDFLPNNKAPKA